MPNRNAPGDLGGCPKSVSVGSFDYLWLKQVVYNMLNQGPVPTQNSSWGAIKALYR